MPELLKQDSPLAEIQRSVQGTQKDSDLSLREYSATGFINLRRDPADAGFIKLVEQATNIRLPETPNTSVSTSGISALWLGPHEWLIVTPGGLEAAMQDSLRKALANRNYAVTDVSSGNTAISLTGSQTRDVLAKGCAIDLHERYFVACTCAQTQVAKANALVWRPDSSPRFDLIVRRSFAEYLAFWLLDAGQEYGLKFYAQSGTTVIV